MANISDKEQSDIERAADDSAIRFAHFDGKKQQTGQTKSVRAYDNQPQGNLGGQSNDASLQPGNIVGSHNDKPYQFSTPGKVNNRQRLVSPTSQALATATMKALSVTVVNGGNGYRDGDTIDLAGGVFSTRAVVTPDTFALYSAGVQDSGSNYQIGQTGNIVGGTATTLAIVEVEKIEPAQNQDETNYNGVGGNGTFLGGIGHAVSDIITMSDGSKVRVDAIAEGVTQFTVIGNSDTSLASTTNNPTLTQVSSTGTGTGFSLTLGTPNQGAAQVQIFGGNAGDYSVLPTDPVATSLEGLGVGLTLNLLWKILTASISVEGDYSVLPTDPVSQNATSGGGVDATFNIDWGVLAITVTDGGSGYTSTPAVTVSGGAGATATATVSSGSVSSISVDSAGSGFTATATVSVASP
jgi:hypothetical protein